MKPKGHPKPRDNPPNTVPNVPADPDSYPGLSDSSLLDSYDSSDDKYYKQIWHAKNCKEKLWSKTRFDETIKRCAKLISKLRTDAYKIG